jgi:transposase
VPRLLVPDNLKSGVHKASFYDPEINRSYGMMAAHYGVGVLPARPRKPRDKAKVEAGVRFAQSYILGRLRHRTLAVAAYDPGKPRTPSASGVGALLRR